MKIVHVIIVNYHQPQMTIDAIQSVLASDGVEVRVQLIDNESDGAWARDQYNDEPAVAVLANAANIGFGAACNQGIERALAAGADFVCLLNNDATVEPGAFVLLAAAADVAGLAAPKILAPDGRLWSAGGIIELARARARNRGIGEIDAGQYNESARMVFASACVLMLSRAALASGVRFHEPYFLYYEDADFCLDLARAGFRIAYIPAASATHTAGGSTPAAAIHRLCYYDLRNRFHFLRRNGAPFQKLIGIAYLVAMALAKALAADLRGDGRRAAAIARGLSDGLMGRWGIGPDR